MLSSHSSPAPVMTDSEFIVWSSEHDDPARNQLAQAHAMIAAAADLRVVRVSGDIKAPRRLLVAGDKAALLRALAPLSAVKIEENHQMKPLRGDND